MDLIKKNLGGHTFFGHIIFGNIILYNTQGDVEVI